MSQSNPRETGFTDRPLGFWKRVWDLYYDGFRSMKVGRQLWALIILKIIVLFGILKLFFFPDILKRDFENDSQRADHVRRQLCEPRNSFDRQYIETIQLNISKFKN